jgi:hypothetical protein
MEPKFEYPKPTIGGGGLVFSTTPDGQMVNIKYLVFTKDGQMIVNGNKDNG